MLTSQFNGRGLAELIRLVFAATDVQYEDVRLDSIDALKPSLTFGQVPLVEIDGKPYVQSISISRYFAKKGGIHGKTDEDALFVDMVVDGVVDFATRRYAASRGNAEAQAEFAKCIPALLSNFEKLLNGKEFVAGYFTLADLALYNLIFNVSLTEEGKAAVAAFPNLVAHEARVAALPKIAAWIAKRPDSPW